ncbi:hypothetical protein EG328_001397 [Venturia inaequalis]|uniref:C2H2-type domain-containing protein n=2 Tax=Venturia inaequalis TaxID=5025 RepID=A0A8H3V016_VENIN|nr:hypothetical protein EG328_001397 [Venturia inaequalis]
MVRQTKQPMCEHCGIAILRRRDTEKHMETYHSENKGIKLEQKIESVYEPVDQIMGESKAIADDEEPASQEAIDALAVIEKQFNEFKIRHINQQLAEIAEEEALLEQDLHPDQIEPLTVTRKFVHDRLQPEQAQYKYSTQNAKFNLESGAAILHSQFFQQVRAFREQKIEKGRDELHKLRRLSVLEEQMEREAVDSS